MIPNIQITGEPDSHPEKPVYDARQLAEGQVNLMHLPVKDHRTEVFDLMKQEGRDGYSKIYLTLTGLVKAGKAVLIANHRETLVHPDGSTGWFRYLEWVEFDTSEILGAN